MQEKQNPDDFVFDPFAFEEPTSTEVTADLVRKTADAQGKWRESNHAIAAGVHQKISQMLRFYEPLDAKTVNQQLLHTLLPFVPTGPLRLPTKNSPPSPADPVAVGASVAKVKLPRVSVILKHPIPSAVIAAVLIGLLSIAAYKFLGINLLDPSTSHFHTP